MKRELLILWVTTALLLSGCEPGKLTTSGSGSSETVTSTRQGTTKPPAGSNSTKTNPSATLAGTTEPTTTAATNTVVTSTVGTDPIPGILSDLSEYSPGNFKSHALVPLEPDTKKVPDKTRLENEKYRTVFDKYLKLNYPEQPFRILSIEDYQDQGLTYKKATARSKQSADIMMVMYYDGTKIVDSFQKDVISRQNTMNRWRFAFRKIIDPIARSVADDETVNLDVSYDYYPENIENIKLDQILDSKSVEYKRCLEMYFNIGYTDPENVSAVATKIYQKVQAKGYFFHEYYIYLEKTNRVKAAYQVPAELIGNPNFATELKKALTSDQPDNLIRQVERLTP